MDLLCWWFCLRDPLGYHATLSTLRLPTIHSSLFPFLEWLPSSKSLPVIYGTCRSIAGQLSRKFRRLLYFRLHGEGLPTKAQVKKNSICTSRKPMLRKKNSMCEHEIQGLKLDVFMMAIGIFRCLGCGCLRRFRFGRSWFPILALTGVTTHCWRGYLHTWTKCWNSTSHRYVLVLHINSEYVAYT